MTETQATPRQAPGVAPAYTMYFDQSAHLDWDWLGSFAQNYWYYINGSGVDSILTAAIGNIAGAGGGGGPYYYTICEMGFFRRYLEEHPDAIAKIRSFGDKFQVLSGGITSADCLVCSGEGFIRNYLVGQVWLNGALGTTAKPHCWLPDDFGQGPELPALLAALGFTGMGFSRLPGPQPEEQGLQVGPLMPALQNPAYDFVWTATDGSSVYAHWMPRTYGIGTQVFNNEAPAQAIADLVALYGATGSTPQSYAAAATPFLYIPFDDDFTMPTSGLQDAVQAWQPGTSNVAVQQGTFDQFMTSVIAAQQAAPPTQKPLTAFPYNGTPYWTGYYASRPALKIHHYEAVRALVAAEIFGLLTQPSNPALNNMLPTGFWSDVDEAWTQFAPSTHHDFVTGTAPDPVYASDQLPMIRGVAERGRALRAAALNALAGMVGNNGGDLLVANSLGFPRAAALAEIGAVASGWGSAVGWSNGRSSQTQRSAEGGTLFLADVPSFGYNSGNLSGEQGTLPTTPASLNPAGTGADSYTLSNGLLSATISAAANWGVQSLQDLGNEGAQVLAGIGNDIQFFPDAGGIYRFGNEKNGGTLQAAPLSPIVTGPGLGAVVLEAGPLRVRIRTTVLINVPGGGSGTTPCYVTREYSLVAGEAFLRMSTTGAAPPSYSVMAAFPLAVPVTAIDHGTTGHWTSVQPLPGSWGLPVFRPTHDFLMPLAASGYLGAVYHGAIPAWAIDVNGSLIGCLFRNTPSDDGLGASGSDPATHTQHYALRVPSNLGGPASGQPLQEALGFNTPLQAVQVALVGAYDGMLKNPSASLAGVASPGSAILTVGKPGSYDPTSLVLRLYQPTNAALAVTLKLPSQPASAQLATATERAVPGAAAPTPTAQGLELTMDRAFATLIVPGLGRSAGRAPADPSTLPSGAPPAPPAPAPARRRGLLRRILDLIRGR